MTEQPSNTAPAEPSVPVGPAATCPDCETAQTPHPSKKASKSSGSDKTDKGPDLGATGGGRAKKDEKKKSSTDLLLELAKGRAELFHSPEGQGWARIKVVADKPSWESGRFHEYHYENWPLRSAQFRNWLTQRYYRKWGRTFSEGSYQEALKVLEAKATCEGNQREIFTRVGEYEGKIILDLGDATWQAIEISPNGWKVVVEPPIVFARKKGMQPLPMPVRGGSIRELEPFLNAKGDSLVLIIAWLVAALRPGGPFPILNLLGEPGAAKSTAGRVLRNLIDPLKPPLRRPPRDSRDLAIAAKNAWVVALDNVSLVPNWLSDDLCSLATGGGFSTRQLY